MTANSTHSAVARTRVEAITGFLDGVGIEYELREHAAVTSAAAEARVAGIPPEQVAKTVVLHDGNAYVVVAVLATDRLDLHKLRELLGATRQLRLASEAEIARDFPTLEVGAAPPFGPMVPAAEVIDRSLLTHERILCSAGDHRHSVLIDPRDVVRITTALTADIRED
jgi:prolyl-tRNA editing enzyme YbaK/EbsC (Cys-tRNA(Pro) deacylase)